MVEFCDFRVEALKSPQPSCFHRLLRRMSYPIRSLSSRNTIALPLNLQNLPDDILIYNIVTQIDRTDVLCLALTSKLLGRRLIYYLQKTWKPVTIEQRMTFLRRLDSERREWSLCSLCHKFYWFRHDGIFKEHRCSAMYIKHAGQVWVSPSMLINPSIIFLVLRARYYDNSIYGLPASTLKGSFSFSGWQISTSAAFIVATNS